MWVARFSFVHDCIIGNRCRKFDINMQSIYLNREIKNNRLIVYSFHKLSGEKEEIKKFFNSLKKDKKVVKAELNNNSLFLVEKTKETPSEFYDPRMFLIKPVIIDEKGWEHWEVASFDRDLINKFIDKTEKHSNEFKLHNIKNEKLDEIYFPKLMPNITELQKKAFELAIKNGYYEVPKKTTLRILAQMSGVSLATYQKHLQYAERKIIPDSVTHLQ